MPEQYILYVGTLEPRKNVATLVRAYSSLPRSLPEARLVIAGARGWGFDEIDSEVDRLGLASRVLFPGYLPREELPLWFGASRVFAYPSEYEGFGMPVLEALACGATVVCSDSSSMPEAAGGAALLVPPGDAEALAQALVKACLDETFRAEHRALGLAHAARFSPLQTGRQMVDCYRRALGLGLGNEAPVNRQE